jgi:N,N-dimethylformamidase
MSPGRQIQYTRGRMTRESLAAAAPSMAAPAATPIDHTAMPACGYTVPWSVRAGHRISLHASSSAPEDTVIGLRRLDGPATSLTWPVRPGPAPLTHGSIVHGSWLEVPALSAMPGSRLDIEFLITSNATSRCLISWGPLSVTIDSSRRLTLTANAAMRAVEQPLPDGRWLGLGLSIGETGIELTIHDLTSGRRAARAQLECTLVAPAADGLVLGRGNVGPAANWRVGRIAYRGPHLSSAWRFPTRGPIAVVPSQDGVGPSLLVRNDPTFACTSARWDGSVHDPRLASDQYDAVHLHEDDLGGFDWPATHEVDIPDDAASGVYAFILATPSGTEQVPFFVRPRAPRAAIAFLVPTLTYAAYADEALPSERFTWVCDDRAHRFAQANKLLSLYDVHADGSGVSLKNLRHPKATLRDDYRYPLSGSPHLLSVDLDLLNFCHANDIAFDLLTDNDLHAEGAATLSTYAGLFTGSHPEYWTTAMQDALQHWLMQGGNLAYLGGNGFMWVTGLDGDRVEVRRGQTLAARTWDGLPGEAVMGLTGEIGGLWRERGRSEFSLVGTGMTLMGFGPARAYEICASPEAADWAWIVKGVAPGPIGSTGRVLGGAAGYEVDRTDARLGTPAGTVVLARALGFGPEYETDGNDYFPGGAAERQQSRRADMAVRRHDGGGFVFSVGSVAWCGALPVNGELNAVGTLTANVLRALSQRTPSNKDD